MFWLGLAPFAPPPEELLLEWWKWYVLMTAFSAVMLMQIIVFDYVDLAITGSLLLFGWRMLRNNMQEMPAYVLIYAVLCGLNCCFTLLPLLGEMVAGRVVEHKVLKPTVRLNGTKYESWTTYSEVAPFLDWARGLRFNVESVCTILTPIFMAFGCCLSVQSYLHVERMMTSMENDVDHDVIDALRFPAERLLPRTPTRDRESRSRAFSGKVFKVES